MTKNSYLSAVINSDLHPTTKSFLSKIITKGNIFRTKAPLIDGVRQPTEYEIVDVGGKKVVKVTNLVIDEATGNVLHSQSREVPYDDFMKKPHNRAMFKQTQETETTSPKTSRRRQTDSYFDGPDAFDEEENEQARRSKVADRPPPTIVVEERLSPAEQAEREAAAAKKAEEDAYIERMGWNTEEPPKPTEGDLKPRRRAKTASISSSLSSYIDGVIRSIKNT